MSVLGALVRRSDRMAAKRDAPVPGHSPDKIRHGLPFAPGGIELAI